MHWRGARPHGHVDTLYSLAAILLFLWALGAIGVIHAGIAAYFLLGLTTFLVALAAFRSRP
jgi:hypothetical protein